MGIRLINKSFLLLKGIHIDYGKRDKDYSKVNNVNMCISTKNTQSGLQHTDKFRKRWTMMISRERLQTLFANP